MNSYPLAVSSWGEEIQAMQKLSQICLVWGNMLNSLKMTLQSSLEVNTQLWLTQVHLQI